MGMRYISYIYIILEKELGLYFNSWITWFYTQGIGKTKGFSPRHDDILMFTKDKKNCRGALIVDPFIGSGTAARVCQQLDRKCIGIDINPNYIKMTMERLKEPFVAFDSVDEKMKSIHIRTP